MAIVLVLREGLKKEYYNLNVSLKVGRHPRNDIVLTNTNVSSFHGQFYRSEDIVFYKDLESRNGSYLNGSRIQFCRFSLNDKLDIEGLIFSIDKDQLTDDVKKYLGTVPVPPSGAPTPPTPPPAPPPGKPPLPPAA